ncbi:hypothetical protein IID20_03770 [Patescibacteria group bacterium]|nr:hypothetical protein [Patescibacteria group bacterium]
MNNKLIPLIIVLVAVIGIGAFYGGTKYMESKSLSGGLSPADFKDFRSLSPEQRQQRFQEFGSGDHQPGDSRGRFNLNDDGERPLNGEIVSQGDGSLVLKLNNDSTKIIFITEDTEITLSVKGVLTDLTAGLQIMISGAENPDGSYTAKVIQVRPSINH